MTSARRLRLCLLPLAAAALLAGCGSSGSSSGTSGESSNGSSSQKQPQASASSQAPGARATLVHRSAAVRGREAGTAEHPAAPVCSRGPGNLVSVQLLPDVPSPRCLEVSADQRLRLVNRSGAEGQSPTVITVRFAGFKAKIAPERAAILDEPFGRYLRPGTHLIQVSGAAGPVALILAS